MITFLFISLFCNFHCFNFAPRGSCMYQTVEWTQWKVMLNWDDWERRGGEGSESAQVRLTRYSIHWPDNTHPNTAKLPSGPGSGVSSFPAEQTLKLVLRFQINLFVILLYLYAGFIFKLIWYHKLRLMHIIILQYVVYLYINQYYIKRIKIYCKF